MRRLTVCLLALFALAGFAMADANVTGKWTGSFVMIGPDGQSHDGEALLDLKQTGSEITGTVGPNADERHNITKGTLAGDKITLECADGGVQIKFALVLAGDRISGDVNAEGDGRTMKAKLDVKRTK